MQILLSLSSRRAWIEINTDERKAFTAICRSPRGERGLKSATDCAKMLGYRSLSSRRAWIEILTGALLGESLNRRSPRGERGLKSTLMTDKDIISASRSPRGERGLKSKTA